MRLTITDDNRPCCRIPGHMLHACGRMRLSPQLCCCLQAAAKAKKVVDKEKKAREGLQKLEVTFTV